jgi:hypothetical protein
MVPGAILNVEDDNLALIAHPQSGVLEGPARGRDVLDQAVDCRRSAAVATQQTPSMWDAGAAGERRSVRDGVRSRRLVFPSGRRLPRKNVAWALRPGRDGLYPAPAEALAQGALRGMERRLQPKAADNDHVAAGGEHPRHLVEKTGTLKLLCQVCPVLA